MHDRQHQPLGRPVHEELTSRIVPQRGSVAEGQRLNSATLLQTGNDLFQLGPVPDMDAAVAQIHSAKPLHIVKHLAHGLPRCPQHQSQIGVRSESVSGASDSALKPRSGPMSNCMATRCDRSSTLDMAQT
jgi:hypothetical protein